MTGIILPRVFDAFAGQAIPDSIVGKCLTTLASCRRRQTGNVIIIILQFIKVSALRGYISDSVVGVAMLKQWLAVSMGR